VHVEANKRDLKFIIIVIIIVKAQSQLNAILFWIGSSARLQPVRSEKTQIKSRPISAANGNPGSVPVDSFRKAHLAFDVLQV